MNSLASSLTHSLQRRGINRAVQAPLRCLAGLKRTLLLNIRAPLDAPCCPFRARHSFPSGMALAQAHRTNQRRYT